MKLLSAKQVGSAPSGGELFAKKSAFVAPAVQIFKKMSETRTCPQNLMRCPWEAKNKFAVTSSEAL